MMKRLIILSFLVFSSNAIAKVDPYHKVNLCKWYPVMTNVWYCVKTKQGNSIAFKDRWPVKPWPALNAREMQQKALTYHKRLHAQDDSLKRLMAGTLSLVFLAGLISVLSW